MQMNTAGERIKTIREERRLTQEDLGALIGAHAVTVSRWERGVSQPNIVALHKLARSLDTSVAYLTGEKDNPTAPDASQAASRVTKLPESNAREAPVAWVPVVGPHVKACCGRGNAYAEDVVWEEIGQCPVPFYMVNGYAWQVGDNGIRIIAVEGNSMEPRIHDGDWVLFVDTRLSNGDIGLVKYEGRLMVRGVLFDGNDKVLLRALNKDYEEILVDLTDDGVEFGILGKVLLRLPKAERVTGLW